MNNVLHFIRPLWFLAFIPLFIMAKLWLKQKPISRAWQKACDPHLLPHLIQSERNFAHIRSKTYVLVAASFMLLSLTGPSLKKLPAPTYHTDHPRLILLDLSDNMLEKDLKPDRLTRAKFKLHDLFNKKHQDKGQFGLMVYTGEPFVVSPLTQDAGTIDALIHQLKPSIMPVGGLNLNLALQESKTLFKQANVTHGDILVLTATPPTAKTIQRAKALHNKNHINLSILPVTTEKNKSNAFDAFAQAGGGTRLYFSHTDKDINRWLKNSSTSLDETKANKDFTIPVWRDDGRMLLIPALLFLLPAFRRGWLSRICI